MAAHVARLVGLLEQTGEDAGSMRALACLRIEQYDVKPALFEAGLRSQSVDTRLWAAVALAKLGRLNPLVAIVTEIEDNPPTFLWGDPWSGYAVLSEAAPVPQKLHDELVRMYGDVRGRNQRLLIGALTGEWDAEGSPLGTSSDTEHHETELPRQVERTELRQGRALREHHVGRP